MIVDDDDSTRRAARRLIKSFGLAVETFASADDFLATGLIAATACLVLDVHMPGLSGLELQSRLIRFGASHPDHLYYSLCGRSHAGAGVGGRRVSLPGQTLRGGRSAGRDLPGIAATGSCASRRAASLTPLVSARDRC